LQSATLSRDFRDMSKSKATNTQRERLAESIQQEIGTDRIDSAAGVIRGVKVLGRESKNGRTYSDRALADAARLYEGVQVNFDHDRKEPYRERGLMEGFGVLRDNAIRADGVYADLHYLTAHPAAPVFVERARRFPKSFGLSHNADGQTSRSGKKTIVESLDKVTSVDIVSRPATNDGLFESETAPVPKTIRQILESEFPKTAVACGLLEMDGMGDMQVPADMPAEGGEDAIWAAFRTSIVSVLDDDALDTKATLKKIGEILKAHDKLSGSAKEKPATDSSEKPADDSPAMESIKATIATLTESLKASEARQQSRDLLDEFGIPFDAALLESLAKLPSAADRRTLAEREAAKLPKLGRREKPLMESVASKGAAAGSYPADLKSFAAAVRR